MAFKKGKSSKPSKKAADDIKSGDEKRPAPVTADKPVADEPEPADTSKGDMLGGRVAAKDINLRYRRGDVVPKAQIEQWVKAGIITDDFF